MRTLEYTYWQDGEYFLGHLNEYPDYETQAYSKEELIENLKDLLADLCPLSAMSKNWSLLSET